MKRIGTVILMMCLCLPLCGLAQGLELAEPISGTRCYPEGAAPEQAVYLFSYMYPQFVAANETDEQINVYFQSVAQDMTGVLFEQSAAEVEEMQGADMPPASTVIDYETTLNDDRYLCVLLTARQQAGNGENETLSAYTFARDGVYAGQPLNLSQVLGLEQAEDVENGGKSTAETLAYRVVWQIVQTQMANVDGDYLDGVDEETLERVFSPETDFYLDADGNVVFFIQSGMLAGEVAGVLTFPFAPAELLSAVKEL